MLKARCDNTFTAFDVYDNTKDGTFLHVFLCYSFLSLLKFL